MTNPRVVGVFDDAQTLLAATRAARDAGYPIADAYTPYAVHGLDEAMGLRSSRLSRVCLLLGLTGAGLALGFQAWAFESSWRLNVGGKSFTALPALVPITFEMAVLFGALGTVLALFWRARLYPGRREVLPAAGVTNDRFALSLQVERGHEGGAQDLLKAQGAAEVLELEADA